MIVILSLSVLVALWALLISIKSNPFSSRTLCALFFTAISCATIALYIFVLLGSLIHEDASYEERADNLSAF